jgi:hypothetical protein
MEYLAIKTESGKLLCQSREERQLSIDFCIKRELTIRSIVVKVFANRNDAETYCDKINEINNLIFEI